MIKNQSMDNYDKSDKRPLSQNCILVYTFNWRTEKWTLPKQQQELKIMDNISCSRNDWILWEGNHHYPMRCSANSNTRLQSFRLLLIKKITFIAIKLTIIKKINHSMDSYDRSGKRDFWVIEKNCIQLLES